MVSLVVQVLVCCLLVCMLVVLLILWRASSPPQGTGGMLGELMVRRALAQCLASPACHVLNDVVLPKLYGGATQIDHVVVSPCGILVIETKHCVGRVSGSQRAASWGHRLVGTTGSFRNPLRQINRHTKALADRLDYPPHYFHSVVVFTGKCTFASAMPPHVIRVEALPDYLRQFRGQVMDASLVPDVVESIRGWEGALSRTQRWSHLASLLRSRLRRPSRELPVSVVCPACGSTMRRRVNGSDEAPFWDCEAFPVCSGTRLA